MPDIQPVEIAWVIEDMVSLKDIVFWVAVDNELWSYANEED